jgi:hypothetical protein
MTDYTLPELLEAHAALLLRLEAQNEAQEIAFAALAGQLAEKGFVDPAALAAAIVAPDIATSGSRHLQAERERLAVIAMPPTGRPALEVIIGGKSEEGDAPSPPTSSE